MRVAAAAALTVWAGGAIAAPEHVGDTEASIPQAHVRVTNWVPDGYKGIWVEAAAGRWYYGEFLGPCIGLGVGDAVALQLSPDGSLNRFSRVIVPRPHRQACAFKSFVTSAAPSHEKAATVPLSFR